MSSAYFLLNNFKRWNSTEGIAELKISLLGTLYFLHNSVSFYLSISARWICYLSIFNRW